MTNRYLEIRRATESDADCVLTMAKAFSIEEGDADFFQFDRTSYLTHFFGPDAFVTLLLAEVAGETAGYTMFHRGFSMPEGYAGVMLEDLYVKPQFRRRGIGRMLMQAAGQAGLEFGARWMSWNVMPENENARAFYRGLGAIQGRFLPHALVGESFTNLLRGRP